MAKLKAYLPVLLWMAVIFCASTDMGSIRHTSRILRPLLLWLKPDISEQTIHDVQVVVRKSAHLSEYAVLALLFWRARRKAIGVPSLQSVGWKEVAMVLVFCTIYAASDETHQIFVPTREPSPLDVLIDTTGAAAGIFLLWCKERWTFARVQVRPSPSETAEF